MNENLNFERDFEVHVAMCERVMEHVKLGIGDYQKEMEFSNDQSPILSVKSRIKSYDSAIAKCIRKSNGKEPTMDLIEEHVTDIAGIRIIVRFEDDIFKVADMLKLRLRLNMSIKRDYITTPKETGYRSLHIMAWRDFFFDGSTHSIPVEIQIRTLAMDLWAEYEHFLRYKNDNPSEEVEKRFRRSAEYLYGFDRSVMELRDLELVDSKEERPEDLLP